MCNVAVIKKKSVVGKRKKTRQIVAMRLEPKRKVMKRMEIAPMTWLCMIREIHCSNQLVIYQSSWRLVMNLPPHEIKVYQGIYVSTILKNNNASTTKQSKSTNAKVINVETGVLPVQWEGGYLN